ncbi:MAG: class I SAM-dependent methyltransferase [Myxococcota bacterium]|nr:class I SAM-dependent methyltransferase [Myxococcota bacterium]MEC8422723.1 class I SAM-dependent methyltransferase [Myxococcota bacterium]
MGDALFDTIARWQGDRPWGRMLDAGTGAHSLRWVRGLDTPGWTAVTGDPARQRTLHAAVGDALRPGDAILTGNWSDVAFLADERFETVLADYLLGALDGFAPYHQDRLFARLRMHTRGRLYIIGLEPYPDGVVPGAGADSEAGRCIRELARVRDACILLAGHRCYREYPLEWVIRNLEQHGFRVQEATRVPIVYRERFVHGQMDVCLRKLACIRDAEFVASMRQHIESVRARALDACARLDGLRFGHDYVVAAEPIA